MRSFPLGWLVEDVAAAERWNARLDVLDHVELFDRSDGERIVVAHPFGVTSADALMLAAASAELGLTWAVEGGSWYRGAELDTVLVVVARASSRTPGLGVKVLADRGDRVRATPAPKHAGQSV